LLADVARIDTLWNQCRATHGGGGPWLLGGYSLADAMYAPVALRFNTYGAQLSPVAAAYVQAVLADPIMGEWLAAARAEPWVIAHDEAGA
jgi:glutathione S-transferase